MSDQIDTYQSDHDIEKKPEFEKIKIQIEKFLDDKFKRKVLTERLPGNLN